MARRYYNVFKNHVFVLIVLIAMIGLSEFTTGTISAAAKIAAGILMIYSVVSYSLWLLRTPPAKTNEEMS
jgi:hypothetical protein